MRKRSVRCAVCMQISGVGMSPQRLAPRSPRQRATHSPGPSHGLPFSSYSLAGLKSSASPLSGRTQPPAASIRACSAGRLTL